MYEDTYTKFEPKDIKYGQYRQTFIVNDPPYYEWDYGDTFNLTFDHVIKDIEKLPDIYDLVKVFIYDYRYQEVYQSEFIPLANECRCKGISIYIGNDLSATLYKGTYYCKVVAYSYSTENQTYNQMTIIHPSDCVLHVR